MSDKIADLLKCFSKRSAQAFQFLESEHGCRRTEGFSRFDGHSGSDTLREPDFSKIPGLFSYVVRYSVPSAILDLSYGDRELLVEAILIYPQHGLRFGAWELAVAAEGFDRACGISGSWVQTVDHMERVVDEFASALRPHAGILLQPSPEMLDRALVQRGQRMRFAQEEQWRKDRDSACIRASEAFHQGNARKAVELLKPFVKDAELPNSSRKVYEKASAMLAGERSG